MELNKNMVLGFKEYCESRKWHFGRYTSEFTFQFRLCRYLESKNLDLDIELESNVMRYIKEGKKGTRRDGSKLKKEIDIDITEQENGVKTAIELKYLRDVASYDIGLFSFCKDIEFLEHLKVIGFLRCYALVFTTINQIYTSPAKTIKLQYPENYALYKCFREDFRISTRVEPLQLNSIKTKRILHHLEGEYTLEWFDFTPDIKFCLIEV